MPRHRLSVQCGPNVPERARNSAPRRRAEPAPYTRSTPLRRPRLPRGRARFARPKTFQRPSPSGSTRTGQPPPDREPRVCDLPTTRSLAGVFPSPRAADPCRCCGAEVRTGIDRDNRPSAPASGSGSPLRAPAAVHLLDGIAIEGHAHSRGLHRPGDPAFRSLLGSDSRSWGRGAGVGRASLLETASLPNPGEALAGRLEARGTRRGTPGH